MGSKRTRDRPLEGIRIAVTRPLPQAEGLLSALRELGAEAWSCPTIRIADPADPGPLQRSARGVTQFDWIVFTSANGVARFWRELNVHGTGRLPEGVRVAAIGPGTADELRHRGVEPRVVPEEYVAEAVAEALVEQNGMAGKRVLLPRAAGARRVLPERLRAAGADVVEVVAYESQPDTEGIARLRAMIDDNAVDMITFTAASTVRHFAEVSGADVGEARVAVIGPITAAAARSVGIRVDAEAPEYNVSGLLRAVCDYFTRSR